MILFGWLQERSNPPDRTETTWVVGIIVLCASLVARVEKRSVEN